MPGVTQHTSSRTEVGTRVWLGLGSHSQALPFPFPLACRRLRGGQQKCSLCWETRPRSDMGLGRSPGLPSFAWCLILG